METKNVSNLKIHKLTQAQYDRELAAGNIDEYALYLTPDEESGMFVVTIDGNDTDGYTADKTYDEILAAYNAGDRPLVAKLNNSLLSIFYPLHSFISSSGYFVFRYAQAGLTFARWQVISIKPSNEVLYGKDEFTQTQIVEKNTNGTLTTDDKTLAGAINELNSGKADATHTHAISDVTGLQSALDGKAAASHGTHVSYSTTAPVMDGTASAGSASTVARSDHTHPTDTSRAAKTDFDSHTANTTLHITSTERTNWNKIATKVDSTTVATSSKLGLVKSGTDITVDSSGNVSVNDDSHNHTSMTGRDITFMNPNTAEECGSTLYLTNATGTGVYIDSNYNSGEPFMNILGSESDESVLLGGIGTPIYGDSAANKDYVDTQVATSAGKKVAGTVYTIDDESVTAGRGAEVFNNYTINKASGNYSHAEGFNTVASGNSSHAEGNNTVASGSYSHVEGCGTVASGDNSHAEGYHVEALAYQHAQGHYNSTTIAKGGTSTGTGTGTAFVVGNGTASAASNAFRVDYNGKPWAKSTITTSGCDYAEFFEWEDQNVNNEDRRGYFVTLNEDKIKIAEPGDYILGIVSGMPSIAGNGDEDWRGRYVYDEFGDFVYEEFEYEVEELVNVTDEETGETTVEKHLVKKTGTKYKENPDYDPTREYTHREERPEWDAVGMLGVLSVRDDGTCQVNGYCSVADDGIATSSESGYRVIKRVNDHIVKVVFR